MWEEPFETDNQKTAQLFQEKYQRQMKQMRRLMLFVFGGIGIAMLLAGTILYGLQVYDEEGFLLAIPFFILGGTFTVIGLFMSLLLGKIAPSNYEKMQEKAKKNGGLFLSHNGVYLSTLVMVHQEQIETLNKQIQQLEDQIRRIKNERRK